MAEIPEEAVRAGAEALSRALFSGLPEHGTWMENDEHLARVAVEAAAPFITQHIGNLLDWRALAAAERDTWQCHHGTPGCHQAGAVEALADAATVAREAFTAGERPDGTAPQTAPGSRVSDETRLSGLPLPPERSEALRIAHSASGSGDLRQRYA
ncbi:hypothetical protein AB0C10_37065, partial [Microbispora amethystogenes]|uniref:hypothetical protein n=1 Tax=Microbispora amethystogenes TaxID=1427754 RepID=UPI0033F49CD1